MCKYGRGLDNRYIFAIPHNSLKGKLNSIGYLNNLHWIYSLSRMYRKCRLGMYFDKLSNFDP